MTNVLSGVAEEIVNDGLEAAFRYFADISNYPVVQFKSAKAFTSRIPNVNFNWVYGLSDDSEETLEQVRGFFKNAQMPGFLLQSLHAFPKDLTDMLKPYGFKYCTDACGMLRELSGISAGLGDVSPTLSIEPVLNQEAFNDWDHISAQIFEHEPNMGTQFFHGFSELDYSENPRLKLFLAKLNGQPVGCSLLHMYEGIAILMHNGVLERYRRQGIGTAMVQARIRLAYEMGCTHAVAQCCQMSKTLYEKQGFERVCGYVFYTTSEELTQ